MKKNLIYLIPLVFLGACNSPAFQTALNTVGQVVTEENLSTDQVAQGLKEALVKGTGTGTDNLSKADGFLKNAAVKILFPEEIQKVESKLRSLGDGQLCR